jgi:hypothetical protein
MKVGFTGTQLGMDAHQRLSVAQTLRNIKPTHGIHGDCIGADSDFHNICRDLGMSIEIYPPIKGTKRAWCKGDIIHEADDYLVRNKKIVDASDIMIATPKSSKEELRSGTWATIRYARKMGKKIYIVFPEN